MNFEIFGPWGWMIAGILLCAAEMLAPGMFMLWIGLAALATGMTLFAVPLGFAWAAILFGVFAVISLLLGRKFYGSRGVEGDRPFLNKRAEALIGRAYVLDQAITAGEGRIRVNDSTWRVRGADMAPGTRVKVTGIEDGVVLRVEAA